jgi:hypothetical protein
MVEQFVPYEIALELKELGFDEPCIACYYKLNMLATYSENLFEPKNYNTSGYCVSAPLWQQAFDWFRKEYHLHSEIAYSRDLSEYFWIIPNVKTNEPCEVSETFKTYEETRLACLEKLIEIVKEKA